MFLVSNVIYLLFWHLNLSIGLREEEPDLSLNWRRVLLSSKLILNCLIEFAFDETAVMSGNPGTKNRESTA